MLRNALVATWSIHFLAGLLTGCSDDPASSGVPQVDSLYVSIKLPQGGEPQYWGLSYQSVHIRDIDSESYDLLSRSRVTNGVTMDRSEFRLPVPGNARLNLVLYFQAPGERTVVMTREYPDGSFDFLDPTPDDLGLAYRLSLNTNLSRRLLLPRFRGRRVCATLESPGEPCLGRNYWFTGVQSLTEFNVRVGDLAFRESVSLSAKRPLTEREIVLEMPSIRSISLSCPVESEAFVEVDGEALPELQCYPPSPSCWNTCTVVPPSALHEP